MSDGHLSDGAGRPRVLHLGFEDPARPGGGGGSVRTHEINRRLAAAFDIIVACARYPGAHPYSRDGVRYVHIGAGSGYTSAVMTYFAAQPAAVSRWRPDLVVEDFGAPLSSWGLPRWTSRPVVGVVQWLFAKEKAREYHLPFGIVERVGLRAHRTLIAVSEDLGAELGRRAPQAAIHVIPNALPEAAFECPAVARGDHIGFLGRLEDAQKGVTLLLRAYADAVRAGVKQDLHVAGTGPDEGMLRSLAAGLGIADRVRFVGAIPQAHRFEWLAKAQFIVMPSRYETFGMVAAEALAVSTPVISFDIPCLRSLVSDATGRRVPALDTAAMADAIVELATSAQLRADLGAAGRASVQGLTWEVAAARQARVYRGLLTR